MRKRLRPTLTQGRRFATPIEPMAQAQDRMPPYHARAGIAHYRSNLFPPGPLIAMNRACGTDRFLEAETTARQSDRSIIQQPLALGAKLFPGRVMVPAIAGDHRGDGLPFQRKAFPGKARRDCPACFRRWPETRGFDGFHTNHLQRQLRLVRNVRL